MNTLTKSAIFAANYKKDCMKRTIFFVFFVIVSCIQYFRTELGH